MDDAKNRLETQSVGKLLVRLALPAITAQLINVLYNIVDRMYIGRLPETGSLALAGLGIAFPVVMLISAFSALAGMGGAPLAAIKLGEKDRQGAQNILGNSFTLLVIISVALTALFYIFKDSFLYMFGASPNTFPYADSYISIYLAGTIFVQLALGLNQFISAQGFATTSMFTVLIGAIANIALDPIFIYALNMGVKGAAIATVISQCISAVWVVCFLTGKKTRIRITWQSVGLKGKIIGPVVALGISPFIMQATESFVQLAFNSGMHAYGSDAHVGAMSILFSTMMIFSMPLMGLGQGAQPIISYNFGAKRLDRVKKAFKLLFISSLCFSIAGWAACMFVPQIFAYIFSEVPGLIELSVRGLRIFMFGIIFMGAQFACQQTLVALGQAKISLFLALLRKIILLIPMAIIFPVFWGIDGLLAAEPIADITAATVTTCVFFIYSRRLFRKKELEIAAGQTVSESGDF